MVLDEIYLQISGKKKLDAPVISHGCLITKITKFYYFFHFLCFTLLLVGLSTIQDRFNEIYH